MKITIKVMEESVEILSKVFDEGVYRVGRSDFSDIVLPSDSVSRSHLELRVTESTIYMTNMSTAGKVKLNGKTMETGEVADGDEIGIAQYRMVIFHGMRDVVEPPPAEAPAYGNAEAPADGGGYGEAAGYGSEEPQASEPAPEQDPQEGYGGAQPPELQPDRGLAFEGTAALNRAETQVEIKPVVAKIIFTDGPRTGEEILLEAYEVTFGRSKKADFFLDDEKLSRFHCKITRVGMGYRLIDLNSRNGTYVNGMRVLEHPLNSFDQVEIGNNKMKFLIHDYIVNEMNRGGGLAAAPMAQTPTLAGQPGGVEQTRSLQLNPAEEAALKELQQVPQGPFSFGDMSLKGPFLEKVGKKRTKVLGAAVIALMLLLFIMPSGKDDKKVEPAKPAEVSSEKMAGGMSSEYKALSPQDQRLVEGNYNSAIKAADREQYEEAVAFLKKIHEVLPSYKQSRDMQDVFFKKVKEKQILEAQEKAKRDDKSDLASHLEEGLEYLKEGDFDRAAESFHSAIGLDPNNQIAIKGLKAAEYKVRSIEQIPKEKDVEGDKRKVVAELFQKAVGAFTNKSYQEAIDTAEKIRLVELKGDTQYLNEAKQIIDRARMLQKEEFEPFLIQAKEKFAEGDYNASRDLCEEMLKRDGAYEEAKECVLKAAKQLNRLAKEAYTHGYILESMNRIEEAKQYWNRAKNYTRPGDSYYDKVNKKLEAYQ